MGYIRYNENELPKDRPEGGILIMEGCTPEWLKGEAAERIQAYIDGDNGDSTDMNVWGYFKDKAGRIYTETTYNYMDYEFYREQFEGNQSS